MKASQINMNEDENLSSNAVLDGDGYSLEITHSYYLRASKRLVDIALALLFVFVFGWLYVFIACGIFATSGMPVIYSQPRIGKRGKIFRLYKFRTMVKNADLLLERHLLENPSALKEWTDFQKLQNDPRITRLGTFLRKTSLDELPQFWNVLMGDMSIIGPRPCMLDQQSLYGGYWRYYIAIRPGITGLWQVSGRNKLSYQQRVKLDTVYVVNLSIKNDFFIFIKTFWVVLTGHGSR